MPDDLTFAVLLTGAGLAIAAGIITGFVELMKAVLAPRTIYGALAAFLTSGLLYGLAAVATGVSTLDAGLVVFVAWLGCATAAVGVHATIRSARG